MKKSRANIVAISRPPLQRPAQKQKEAGITLVALIITVIILVILAAVTIITLQHSEMIKYAVEGTQNYSREQIREEAEIKKLEDIVGNTLQNIQNGGTGGEENEKLIGKYVDYKAEAGNYTALKAKTGMREDQEFTTEDVKWRIWNVDNDNIYLITEKPSMAGGKDGDGKLYLCGAFGVKESRMEVLTDISSNCNSNSSYTGLIARNLNLDDIEKVALKKEEPFYKTAFTQENATTEWKDEAYFELIYGNTSSYFEYWLATYLCPGDGFSGFASVVMGTGFEHILLDDYMGGSVWAQETASNRLRRFCHNSKNII